MINKNIAYFMLFPQNAFLARTRKCHCPIDLVPYNLHRQYHRRAINRRFRHFDFKLR